MYGNFTAESAKMFPRDLVLPPLVDPSGQFPEGSRGESNWRWHCDHPWQLPIPISSRCIQRQCTSKSLCHHSNIFIEAQHMADEIDREDFGEDVAYRVRIDFRNLLELARENRTVAKAVAAGSVPPEMEEIWKNLRSEGVRKKIIDGRKAVPDLHLQQEMLLDGMNNEPGTVVLLTGDGAGWGYNKGFLPALQGMRKGGWTTQLEELLQQMAEEVGGPEWPFHKPG